MSYFIEYFVRKFASNTPETVIMSKGKRKCWPHRVFILSKYSVFFKLTYLIYLYQVLIRWNKSIGSNALVMTKILITPEWHLYFVFSGSDSVYFTSFRFVPRECWCRNTIRKTLQSHCLANPRLLRWRGDTLNCGRV